MNVMRYKSILKKRLLVDTYIDSNLTCMSLHRHGFMHLSHIPSRNTIIYPTRIHHIAIIGICYRRELVIILEATHLPTNTRIPQLSGTIITGADCKCCRSREIENRMKSREGVEGMLEEKPNTTKERMEETQYTTK